MAHTATRYSAVIPDEEYWRGQIKCQYACPVHTDARGYIRAIAAGNYEAAYLIARGPNPLASICGRVCGAPCEAACRRGAIDQPVSIRALKRFAADRFGGHPLKPDSFPPGDCEGLEEITGLARFLAAREYRKPEGAKVAIVGSGPAGLAAAHDLALMGLAPVIFEAEPKPAGMLYTGIPAYRLPRALIDAEIELIRALGVEFRCGVKIGRDLEFEQLRRDYAAVIVAVGAKRARMLALPGSDAEGIYGGVDFLRAVALGERIPLGRRVLVIGGGNVAFDVSRSAVRYADDDPERRVARQTETDISRVALRQEAVREVHLACLESREEMPADEVEIVEGEEEGIIRHNQLGPKEFLFREEGGRKLVHGVRFRHVVSVFDSARRFAPVYDDTRTVDLEADTVLLSVGQMPDVSFLNGAAKLQLNPETLETDMPGVFAAGDVAYGARLMIDAIASGKKAARSVYQDLTGRAVRVEETQLHFEIAEYRRESGYEGRRRVHIPAAPARERLADPQRLVETGYTEVQAAAEAGRCLDCGVNTIFDGEKCILCGGCVDVCPTLCLKLVGLEQVSATAGLEALLAAGNYNPADSAILKDEERCIRCALCAQRCPTHAITMERFQFRQEWTYA
ncbi:MAG TPA: FAD-dependent oxidoreductase [Candidatus Acidoferrales bacterium]|nr:FAD-dependent oxidoreductase [Candidatus Acidoferrales bacterium]